MKYPEFIDLITKYDIICFQETKTDNCDHLSLPGYTFKMKNRFSLSNRRSGGLIICYKDEISKYVRLIENESNFVMWINVSSQYTKLDDDVILGSVYIPPENTRYSSSDSFREIENDILEYSSRYKYVCLAGDFNSRTSIDLDHVSSEDNDFDDILIESSIFEENSLHIPDNLTCPTTRENMDKTKNNYGNLLLDLCRYTGVYIVNGRIGDNITGKLTSKNAATVDYFLATPDLLNIISNSDVLHFSNLFSDAHCPLDISININTTTCTCNACNPRTDIQPKKEQIKKWNLAKADEFNEYLDLAKIETIDNALDLLTDDHVNLNNINDTVKNIGDIFVNAAKHTFGTYNPKKLIKEPTMRKKRNRINHGLTTSAGKKEKTRGALKGYTDYVNPKKIKELKIKAKKNIKRP
ncbi:unnamed protein product [Mytilus edulis]|uniref:Endonuclease/exonuclease/phosphatase domain-containing protein n=1 Tax=Mytilus edulis TaxID=6550 RepID=A0A8S3PLM0_MYTED|nr:unnamed protein product [Mytilus edulis]